VRHRGVRRGSRSKGEYIWAAVVADEVSVTATPQGLPLVITGDFANIGGQKTGITLLAIRGWYSLTSVASASPESFFAAIIKHDEDADLTAVENDPATVGFYVDEDILWTGGWLNGAMTTDIGIRPTYHELIDVKARRKLKSGENISIQLVTNGGGNAVDISGVWRALLKVG